MKYKQIALNFARKLLSDALVWNNDIQWFCCKHCKEVQVVPLPPNHLHNLQRHSLKCFFFDAWQLIRSQYPRHS